MHLGHLELAGAANGTSVSPNTSINTASNVQLSGLRVVVVEDEAITQMQLRMILSRQGLQIVGTGINGEQGLELVRNHHPDLVLMDIKMATNTDGLDATR